jgi:hypothetical protein
MGVQKLMENSAKNSATIVISKLEEELLRVIYGTEYLNPDEICIQGNADVSDKVVDYLVYSYSSTA